MDLEIVPRNMTWADKGFAEALVLARQGNEGAQHHLRRLVKRDPDSEQGKEAAATLVETGAL